MTTLESATIHVSLPDASQRALPAGATVASLAESISRGLAKRAVAARINGNLADLSRPLQEGDSVQILTSDDPDTLEVLRHSTAHLMAMAVQKLFPEAKITIGPVTADGFFYDFDVPTPFTPEDLVRIEGQMRKLAEAKLEVTRTEIAEAERGATVARFEAEGEPYKAEILTDILSKDPNAAITLYGHGEWSDLCRGPHLPNTALIRHFKLLTAAGAYWRGDEKNKMLQRIYGTVYWTEADLKAHMTRLEEAARRDHRKLGKELELFMFHEVAPAMPFFLPKGTFVYNQLLQFIRELYDRHGYAEVITPLAYDPSLFRTSGHLGNYNENMYRLWTEDEAGCCEAGKLHEGLQADSFVLKPMNCPSHCVIFGSKRRSYRELPWRVADFARLHRYERGGVVHGLARVRSFSQDDAHIFCTEAQVAGEIERFIAFLYEVYAVLDFSKIDIKLSTRPDNRIGDDAQWDRAEAALEQGLRNAGLPFEILPGEGAFYGPKIEFHIQDAIGRSWQLGTIQYDPNLPERFDLSYIGEDGQSHRPIMLHRAILGSLERFFAVYLEHCAGAFPLWLAPTQAVVIPISEEFRAYATEVTDMLRAADLRVELDVRNESLNYRIRDAQVHKVPYMLIIGKQEVENRSVAVRSRVGGRNRVLPLDEVVGGMVLERDSKEKQARLVPSETPAD
ncbi:MAG: threonine--tRNA ligase [Candidatus Sericytochromatia bacterium]|nr:threonine--tRNA ligase [Candidatus Sericytochromatia bacterium]